jgi:diguanylate cyclase (GGDEF)-like protein/PAS domain S-box-containing protein
MVKNLEYLFDFIDDLPVGIARADTSGRLPNHFNRFFLKMFGWKASEIDTLEKWFLNAYPEDAYRTDVMKLWNEMTDEAESQNKPYSSPVEVKVACRDGSFRWCEARYYRKGHFVYGIFVDISERKKAQLMLEELSLVDPLTEVRNRRYFNIQYYDRWNLSKRSRMPLSIILCDVDNFKRVNDAYGHLAGDRVLVGIAAAISATLKRSNDFLARYGGEEFVIVSYDCDEASALQLCRLIKEHVEQVNFPDLDDSGCCTMSYGVSTTIAGSGMSPEDFINQADKALYEAKSRGKDRIVVYKEP